MMKADYTADGALERTPGASARDVVRAFRTQCRVVMALILRESQTRYGKHKLGFVWAFAEPVLMVALFALIMVFFRSGNPNGMPQVPFMICGILPVIGFRSVMSQMQSGIANSKNLLGFPQVTTFDCILAKGLMESAVVAFVFVFMLAMAHLLGEPLGVERPLEVFSVFVLVYCIAWGAGFLFATLVPIVPSLRQLSTTVLGRPLLLGSGVFYTADSVPMPFRDWLLYNPLLHAVELIRGALFVQFETAHGSVEYLGCWAIGSVAVGLTTHQALRRRAIVGL